MSDRKYIQNLVLKSIMKSSKMHQHKRIKNSPMRSPSPDYANRHQTGRTSLPLGQVDSFVNISSNASPSKFPHLPIQLVRRKTASEAENIQPAIPTKQIVNQPSTGIRKPQRQSLSVPISEISPFDTAIEDSSINISIHEIQKLIKQIHSLLFQEKTKKDIIIESKLQNKQEGVFSMCSKLNEIKLQITNLMKFNRLNFEREKKQKVFQSFGAEQILLDLEFQKRESPSKTHHIQFIKNKDPLIINDSPIKKDTQNEQESFISLMKHNEIENENNKLKKQVSLLKCQLQLKIKEKIQQQLNANNNKNNQKDKPMKQNLKQQQILCNKTLLSQRFKQSSSHEQDSSMNSATSLFLKQKIVYLENQLENKIYKLLVVENQKNEQIKSLKQKLQTITRVLQTQTKNYKDVIKSLKIKIQQLKLGKSSETKPKIDQNTPIRQSQRRSILNSETINISKHKEHINETLKLKRLSLKNALSWDKEEVLSIYDQQNLPEQSLYSEAGRVDIQNLFSARKQLSVRIQKIKEHYQQIIIQNMKGYHEDLEKLRDQLRSLKYYIKSFDIQQQNEDYRNCQKCEKFVKIIGNKNIRISQFERQINILRQQVEVERKQSEKLRDLIHNICVKQQSKSKQQKTNKRRKGIQKRPKNSFKGSQSNNNSEQLLSSGVNQDLKLEQQIKYAQTMNLNDENARYDQDDTILIT